jgi:DNA topoisomerase-1
VDIEHGFKPRYVVTPDKKDVVSAIKDAARDVAEIYIASDPDREGEAIAFHVAEQLKSLGKPIKRADFHQITKSAVQQGLKDHRPLDRDLYAAAVARRVLDRIVGFMVSPYLRHKLEEELPKDTKVSAGRVQSVALRLIVEREREIKAFVPEDFWNITAALARPKAKTQKFTAKYPQRVTTKTEANKIKKDLDGASYWVDQIKAEEKLRYAPPPLTTNKLLQDTAARFKFAASRTMQAAQSLYEGGHITYHRTDSVRSDPTYVAKLRDWLGNKGFDVPKSPNQHKNTDAAQDGHEAIRPTDVEEEPDSISLVGDEAKVYRLIWARYVASQMKAAIYDTVNMTVATNKKHILQAEGRVLKYAGWLEIAGDFVKKDKDVKLPKLKKGDDLVLVPPKVKAQQSKTKPPSRYNDGTLVKELKRRGIGRPSTYASIIDKISGRNYVRKLKEGFAPTELGGKVVDDLKQFFAFMDFHYTAQMEKHLDKMAQGKLDYEKMLGAFFDEFKVEYRKAKASQGRDAGIPCPECGDGMVVRHSKYGFFAGCVKYPECRGLMGVRIEGDQVIPNPRHQVVEGVFCPSCGKGMVKRDGQYGPFYSCVDYPRCTGKRKVPFGKKCKSCGGELHLTVFDGEPKLACMEYHSKGCRNVEDIPEGIALDWIPPAKVTPKQNPRKVEKVLKARTE